ncbi:MAG: hypothetical protein QOK13_1897 [Gaiellaceae bacterium]|jgi:hypothetical protein|nr:hypothetical protein [Gaiellaceae bacterium]
MKKPLFIVLPALVLVLSACGPGGESKIASTGLQGLVLRESDLSGPFSAVVSGPTASLDVQGTPRSNLHRFDRRGGWVIRLHRPGTKSTHGPLVVASTVDVFGGSGGAKQDLELFKAQLTRLPGGTPVAVSKLGDDATAATSVQTGTLAVRSFTIAWRERNAVASVTANGFDGKVSFGDILRLARRQEQKLAQA